jgi:hypothetical protein
VPTAVNCSEAPELKDWEGALILIDVRVEVLTVTKSVPETELLVAVITTLPGLRAVSRPVPLIVAIVTSELCHVDCEVRSWVVLSEYVPRAASCSVSPAARDAPPLTVIEARGAFVIESGSAPETPLFVAVTVTVPDLSKLTSPAALTVAKVASELCQVTCEVNVAELPSLYFP